MNIPSDQMKKQESTGKTTTPKKRAPRKKKTETQEISPLMAEASAPARQRRNVSSSIERTDRYKNIDDGMIPFKYTSTTYGQKSSSIEIKDTVVLCQKAYYNFAIFRNMIDLMTEFSVSNLYFRGGNRKAKKFFESLFRKINLWSFQDMFFREYYRSGNVFVYRFDAKLAQEDAAKISQVFGEKSGLENAGEDLFIPSRYCILNPADIKMTGSLSFSHGPYYKLLSNYELQRLKNPKSDQDKEVFDSLPEDVKSQINEKKSGMVHLPLDINKVHAVFYKKQDYEPFAVPMGYPVLEDINFKQELKKMDMAIARTMQQAILLVTMGAEPDKGGINQKNLEAMQTLFGNQSVGRVLISDYTTDAKFVIPQIGDLMDPKKYEIVNNDINIGLNNIFFGTTETFSSQSAKIKVFIARLEQARQAFLENFLMPEIRRIAKEMNFKSYPTAHFDEVALSDDVLKDRVYTRLLELGVLSPQETFEAMETGRFPDPNEALESQEEMRKLRDKGYYEPLMGGPNTQEKLADKSGDIQLEVLDKNIKSQEKLNKEKSPAPSGGGNGAPQKQSKKSNTTEKKGRPAGSSGIRQTTKRMTPVGASESYSIEKIKDNIALAQKLENEVAAYLRKKHEKRKLSNKQKEIASEISDIIVANEKPEDWLENVEKYCENPQDTDNKRVLDIQGIQEEHQVDAYLASILYSSKV
jgi:hypothetical protein